MIRKLPRNWIYYTKTTAPSATCYDALVPYWVSGRSSIYSLETNDCSYALPLSSLSHYLRFTLRIHFSKYRKGNPDYMKYNTKLPSISLLPGLHSTFSFWQQLCFINCLKQQIHTKPVYIHWITSVNCHLSKPATFLTREHSKRCISKGRDSGRHGIRSTLDDCTRCILHLCSSITQAISDSERKISPDIHGLHFLPLSTEAVAAADSVS